MPLSDLILVGSAVLQGVLLMAPARGAALGSAAFLSAAGFLGAAAALLVFPASPGGVLVGFGMMEDQALLRLPRAALFLAGLLLGRSIVSTGELPAARKKEVLFLLSALAILCDMLVLSKHALLSCILLVLISWLGIFLSGLAFRGRLEGEAVLKFWVQASVAGALGVGSVLAIVLVSGGAAYEVIAGQMAQQPLYSPGVLFAVVALCLPFFLVGGVFPFHFIAIDRDQGLPWAVQLVFAVMVQGAITLALWKMGVGVFGAARPGGVAEGLRVLQLAGLVGGFWLAVFALSQTNAKRLFSALVGAQWFAILAAGALPSSLGLSAVTYAFSSAFLWSALLGFIWSRLQEFAGAEGLPAVYGIARRFRGAGLILLVALAAPLCIPGFAGFPTIMHLLGAMIEQQSMGFLLAEAVLLALICLTALRLGADLLFREPTASIQGGDHLRYGALDAGAMALLGGALVLLGFLWHRVFALLTESAKAFL
jgi:NADH:ubiquinone oxidoreductase subunit 2 (subunit N)